MIRCAECNEENMDGLEYCDSCGAKLEAIAADGAGAADATPAPAEAPAAPEAADADASADAPETAPEAATEEAADAPVEASTASEPEVAQETPADTPQETPADTPQETPADTPQDAPVEAPASEGPGAGMTAALTLTRGGTVGKVFELQAGDNLVGRWDPDSGSFPEVDMENDDPEARISRKHALIKFGDTLTIEDIGSLNGTFVNRGPRLEPGSPATLKDGDEIIIGKTFFKISVTT